MATFLSAQDLSFQLWKVHRLDELFAFERYTQHDAATCESMLEAATALAEEHFLPHAALADAQEPHFDGQRVQQPAEVGRALRAYIDSGFLGAAFPSSAGGLQLPSLFHTALAFPFSCANIGTSGYTFLTVGAASLLLAHGSDAQKQRYLPHMLSGRFFGTMCLSEPHAGSSLADIRTRATPLGDGRYRISGNKMWISGGEHDLSENIVNMVLARIDGAPAGVKGISLFIVPKKHVAGDGAVGARNGVRLISLNHKMGYRAITNCALAFGDGEDCVGELIGEPHKGLSYMFHMMNEARIGVGMGAVALGTAGYRYALDYARTRPQGRPLTNRDPASAPIPIIQHADVRRMLLAQKAYVEAGLSLGLYCARLVDEQHAHPEASRRKEAATLLDLLTPIIKAWPSEWCLKANELAIQCLGGYGYTRDYPVERLYRDNRLNPIHEGTNGIQSLDLLGRKVLGDGGRALQLLSRRIQASIAAAGTNEVLKPLALELTQAMTRIAEVTTVLGGAALKNIEIAMANSAAYLNLLGHTVMAWQWLDQARVALEQSATAAGNDRAFYDGKVQAARFFFVQELPKTVQWAELLKRLDATTLEGDDAGW